jgi:hypothetical protein
MTEDVANKNLSILISKFAEFFRKKITWKNIRYYCFQSRKDVRIFWFSYIFIFIIFMIAFL